MLACAGGVAVLALTAPNIERWSSWSQAVARLETALGRHPYFSVRDIRVTGSRKLSRAQLVSLAGLKSGMSIWEVDPKSIEVKLGRHPWIRKAMVQREFPQRILIQVEEWVPQAIVALEKLYYVNRDGSIFKEVEPGEEVNFPFITGLGNEESVFDNPMARKKITEAIGLNDRLAGNAIVLSEIRFLPREGVVVYPISHPVPLHMGWGNWPVKVQRLKRVLAEWKGREQRLASLNMSFENRVVVELKGD